MRPGLVLISVLGFFCAGGYGTASAAHWEERPFFPRRPHQKVPPPQYYATSAELPAGAEVRIKIVKCPKRADLSIHDFLGGPVFSKGIVKEFSDLKADQVLTFKLEKTMKVGITTRAGEGDSKETGTCAGLEEKDGHDVMKYSFGDVGDLVIEVEVVGE